jgi:ABC-2 type transport system ATP-binding protein
MADIQELCDRVIVIDKGRKIYDGDLDLLESAGGRKKIVRFRPVELPFPGLGEFAAYAPQTTDDGEIVLHVPNPEIVVVTGRILAAGAVADIAISDVPLEDIIADLFNAQPPAATGAGT